MKFPREGLARREALHQLDEGVVQNLNGEVGTCTNKAYAPSAIRHDGTDTGVALSCMKNSSGLQLSWMPRCLRQLLACSKQRKQHYLLHYRRYIISCFFIMLFVRLFLTSFPV